MALKPSPIHKWFVLIHASDAITLSACSVRASRTRPGLAADSIGAPSSPTRSSTCSLMFARMKPGWFSPALRLARTSGIGSIVRAALRAQQLPSRMESRTRRTARPQPPNRRRDDLGDMVADQGRRAHHRAAI